MSTRIPASYRPATISVNMRSTGTSTLTSGYCVLDCELLNSARNGWKGSGVCLFRSPTPKLSTVPSKPAT
jgi:hypothetical protein